MHSAALLNQHGQCGHGDLSCTAIQALADYAELLVELKAELHAEHSPVIGFGGSYGEHPAD